MKNRSNFFYGLLVLFGLLFTHCPLPPEPPGPDEAGVSVFLESSDGTVGTTVTDSVGKNVSIGVVLNFTQYIDSTIVMVMLGESVEYREKSTSQQRGVDTVYFTKSFSSPGERHISVVGYITGQPNSEASATIRIVGASAVNNPPSLVVSGTRLVTAGETVVLSVTATDSDVGQTASVQDLRLPDGATFVQDTLRWVTTDEDIGNDTAIFIASDNGTPAMSTIDTVAITVNPTGANRAPVISVNGRHVVIPGETMVLAVTATDPDVGQVATVTAIGLPEGATFSDNIFQWTTAVTNIGIDTVLFVASDDGTPGMTDTEKVVITVSETLVNSAPVWNPDTLRLNGQPGNPVTQVLSDLCSDPDGDAAVFTLLPGAPAGAAIAATTLSFTPATTDIGTHILQVVAADPYGGMDTLVIILTIVDESQDIEKPVITLITPSKDTVVGQSSITVSVRCSDAGSGIAQVTIGGVVATAGAEDIYTATVSGLAAGTTTTVTIVATDAASVPNTDSVSVQVRYDNDGTGPSIELNTPLKDSVSTNSSSYTVTLNCSDPSGVVSVNGVFEGTSFTGVSGSDNAWDITIEGLAEGMYSIVVFTATDGSLGANTSEQTIYIKYDPTMDDVDGPTISQISGPESGTTVSNAQVTIVDTIFDPSDIQSVTWTLNGGASQPMTPVTGMPGQYSLTASFTAAGDYAIVVTAVDNSSQGNDNTQTIELEYVIAPSITQQPVSTSVCPGEEATVSVTAAGTPPLQYQWHNDDGPISGANDAEYTFSPAATTTLTCVVSNGDAESATSDPCAVTVNSGVAITQQPAATTNSCPGTDATISIAATGGTGLAYQWFRGTPPSGTAVSGSDYSGSTSAELVITGTVATEGTYYCVVTNSDGCIATSTTGAYAMNNAVSVALTSTSTSTCTGENVTFTAVPNGGMSHQYQWYRNGAPIGSPSTDATYTTATAGTYHCTATSSAGCVGTSNEIELTVNAPPTVEITGPTEPVCEGNSANFSVTASGGSGFSYQWYSGTPPNINSPITGQTSSSMSRSQAGSYFCRVTNSAGCSGYSDAATLEVTSVSITAPSNVTVCVRNEVVLSVSATGGATGYQWYKENPSGSDELLTDAYYYSGSTTRELTFVGAHVDTQHSGNYYCIVQAGSCTFKSSSGTVTVKDGPVITQQPVSGGTIDPTVYLALGVTMRRSTNSLPCVDDYTYRWYHEGDPDHPVFGGGGSGCQVFIAPGEDREGTYFCIITNPATGCSVSTDTITVVEE